MKTVFSVMAVVVLTCGIAAADNVLINYPDNPATSQPFRYGCRT